MSSRCLLSIETEALFLGAVLQFKAALNSLLAVEVKSHAGECCLSELRLNA